MLFNILTVNHGDSDAITRLAPLINYLRYTLARCGHEVIVANQALHKRAVNVFLAYFPDREPVENLVALKSSQGLAMGVVATELIVDGTIPYAQHGLIYSEADRDAVTQRRIENLNRLAPSLDFIWCFLDRTTAEYRDRCPIVETFPVGHVYRFPDELRKSPRDIDVLFFGTATPHRLQVLDAIKKNGISPMTVGRGFGRGYASVSELDSLLDRAKIGLNLTLHSATESDKIDPRFASCHRVPEMLEHDVCIVSEPIPLDNHYGNYMISAEPGHIARTCRELLVSGEWQRVSSANTGSFRRDMDVLRICKPVVDKTVHVLRAAYPDLF
jgi:hypothetical protein